MSDLNPLIERLLKTQRGFKDMQLVASDTVLSNPPEEALDTAHRLYAQPEYQPRITAVFIYGLLAASQEGILMLLRQKVSLDPDRRVQDILAKALHQYCSDRGYVEAISTLKDWLKDPQENVRHAATEGPRPWLSQAYFTDHPEAAIKLLSALKGDPSDKVRLSAGKALCEISRYLPELIRKEVGDWDRTNARVDFTYKLATKALPHGV